MSGIANDCFTSESGLNSDIAPYCGSDGEITSGGNGAADYALARRRHHHLAFALGLCVLTCVAALVDRTRRERCSGEHDGVA